MSFLSDRFELRLATGDDGDQILRIYESGDFQGKISVLYTRRPNPYLSLLKEGNQVIMPVVYDRVERIICGVGCCVIRKAYFGGQLRTTGYLTGLKLLPEYRRKVPYFVQVYQFLYEQTKSLVDYFYTTILVENVTVQRMLEKHRRGMPVYDYKGVYTVYCFKTGRRSRSLKFAKSDHALSAVSAESSAQSAAQSEAQSAGIKNFAIERGNFNEAAAFYRRNAVRWDLFPDLETLDQFPAESVYTMKDASGETVAACILWNQQDHKQYIITHYEGVYKFLQHLPLRWLGYPDLPECGRPANYASFHMLCVKDNNLSVAECFIKKIAEVGGSYDFLMLGLFQDHPFTPVMESIRHIKYQSKFYSVYWDDMTFTPDFGRLHIDVGLL